MSDQKIKISCDVCLDLIPLVLDHVASKDSVELVTEHTVTCMGCREMMQTGTSPVKADIDDQKFVASIKKSMYLAGVMLVLIGGLLGLGLTNSMAMFYNFIIMPLIGGCIYFLFTKRWYYAPIGLFLVSYVWLLISFLIEGMLEHATFWQWFASPWPLTLIYTLLTSLGILIGALLKFAFKKERAQ